DPQLTSPKKKVQQEKKKSRKIQKSNTKEAVEETAVVEKIEVVKVVDKKKASPNASPKNTVGKQTKTTETTVETSAS
ncbi:hypothetical protein L9G74_22250, partial [Shewanella sp. C32]